jgi:hypothetical protein
MLRYQETSTWVEQTAPALSFRVRPFRRDLLLDGSVVKDFRENFLDGLEIPDAEADDIWENKGIPTEIATFLTHAPAGLLWRSEHNNNRAWMLMKQLAAQIDAPEAPETLEGRRLLHRFCFYEYESGNQQIIQSLGWQTEHFIAPPADSEPITELSALDTLWRPHASQQEAAFALLALREAVSAIEKLERHPPIAYKLRRAIRRLLGPLKR